MRHLSDIRIDPDPAREGQPVTITFPHGGPWFVGVDPDGEVLEVSPGEDLQAEIAIPGEGGETFTVTDLRDPPTEGNFNIVSNGSTS